MRITIPPSLTHLAWVTRYEATRLLHKPRHGAHARRSRLTLSFWDTDTLAWLRVLKTAPAETPVTAETLVTALVGQYMARMAVIAGRGPIGMRGALIAACDLTDRLGAAIYTAAARQPNPWAQAGAPVPEFPRRNAVTA